MPLRQLAVGGFSQVFLVKNRMNGKHYALKKVKKGSIMSKDNLKSILIEKKILSYKVPFILSMDYMFENNFYIYFCLDYISGGTLSNNLKKVKTFSEEQVKFFTAQLVYSL